MSEFEDLFDDPFYRDFAIPKNVLRELEAYGNPTVLISVVSITNGEGNVRRVKQVMKFSNSRKCHLAELHKIDDSSVLYTKDVDHRKQATFGMRRTKVSERKISMFEKAFAKETASFPNDQIPELYTNFQVTGPKVRQDDETPKRMQDNGGGTPKRRLDEHDPPKGRRGDHERELNQDGPVKWRERGDVQVPSHEYVLTLARGVNRIRRRNKVALVEFDEEISKLAAQFARQTLRPDASNLNFAQVQIPKTLASKMATMQIATTADDPTEIILKAIENDNEEATELAPFTHIGIGVARVKIRFAVARIYACKMPTTIKDVREITHDQEQQLVSLINQLRKKKGLSRLKHSRRMTDRAMKYQKLLFTGVDPNSEVAMNELMNIVHDYSFKEFSGGMTTNTNDPMTEIFDQLTKTNSGDLLDAYDEIGTTIVRDQYNHWRWLISLEHY